MNLGEMIEILDRENPEKRLVMGLGSPDSYRGYYDQLAFALKPGATVGEMLREARDCLGKTFTGYKGGEFTMCGATEVWVAQWGDTGSELSRGLLEDLLSFEAP